jgi:hypothetical protein
MCAATTATMYALTTVATKGRRHVLPLLLPHRGGDLCCHYCHHIGEEICAATTATMYALTTVTTKGEEICAATTVTMYAATIVTERLVLTWPVPAAP